MFFSKFFRWSQGWTLRLSRVKTQRHPALKRHPWGQPCNRRWCPEAKLTGRPLWGGGGGDPRSVTDPSSQNHREHGQNPLSGSSLTRQRRTWGCFCSQVSYRESQGRSASFQAEEVNSLLLTSVASLWNEQGSEESSAWPCTRGALLLSFQLIFHHLFLKPHENRSGVTSDVWRFRLQVDIETHTVRLFLTTRENLACSPEVKAEEAAMMESQSESLNNGITLCLSIWYSTAPKELLSKRLLGILSRINNQHRVWK